MEIASGNIGVCGYHCKACGLGAETMSEIVSHARWNCKARKNL
jgi:hypothetical protein